MRLIVVSGLSGAGKTVALKQYEDLGYYCIDNMPLALVVPMVRRMLRAPQDGPYGRLALGVDARASADEIARFPGYLQKLEEIGVEVQLLFLTASEDVLLRRYSETRRRHPLSSEDLSLLEAIRHERSLLAPIANLAEQPLDSSSMNLHELREAVLQRLPEASAGRLSVLFLSFGFKNGVPDGCDYVFDVRCLPNPHWDARLRPLTGRDEAIREWLGQRADVRSMLADIGDFLDRWLPAFRSQDRAYVTVAVGCTGGQHRSVYIVDQLEHRFRGRFEQVMAKHRELM